MNGKAFLRRLKTSCIPASVIAIKTNKSLNCIYALKDKTNVPNCMLKALSDIEHSRISGSTY